MAMSYALARNIACLVLEVVYLVGLLWNVCGKLAKMGDHAAHCPPHLSASACLFTLLPFLFSPSLPLFPSPNPIGATGGDGASGGCAGLGDNPL
ncbi:unnamed protein product [Closterium sp. NIES-64]|nr:unnamed protein product [Closterium sp. NIES-65]CAI5982397.1 unnamed protein product [Closterium sp. NIES-64]